MPRGRPKNHVAPCSFCNRQFKRLEHLQRHERIHTQEKPFVCNCGSSFARKDLLARHAKQAHDGCDDTTERFPSEWTEVTSPGQGQRVDGIDTRDSMDAVSTSAREAESPVQTDANMDTIEAAPLPHPPVSPGVPAQTATELNEAAMSLSSALVFDSDGLDWLWQTNSSTANSDFPQFEFQPMIFDPCSFGLTNPVATPALSHAETSVPVREQAPVAAHHSATSLGDVHQAQNPTEGPVNGINAHQSFPGVPLGQDQGPSGPDTDTTASTAPGWMLEGDLSAPGDDRARCPWRLSVEAYDEIKQKLALRLTMLPFPFTTFTLPTRHTLSRYLEGYVRGFHEHLPFLHLPTFAPAQIPEELLLALAAAGALYKFEHAKGHGLFAAARALANLRQQELVPRIKSTADSDFYHSPEGGAHGPEASPATDHHITTGPAVTPGGSHSTDVIPVVQALNVLMAMASWGDGQLAPSALEMAGQLSTLLRLSWFSEPDPIRPDVSWTDWIRMEERRRTMMTAFTLLNLQFVAFNTPTPLMIQEVGLYLPHPIDMWRAATEAKWAQVRERTGHRERAFKETLRTLLAGRDVASPTGISAFGNYVLMHGIVQQILVDRQAASLRGTSTGAPGLEDTLVASLSKSLQCWQRCWSSSNESTLDPKSTHGPLAFNSTALLRIAYIRLVADLGPHRSVLIRNPACLAKSVARAPLPALQRSSFADFAVGQCIGALSILVRSGVDYVSRTYSHTWSIIHSLSHIECACFLSLWLRSIANVVEREGPGSLRQDERRLLGMMTSMVAETEYAQSFAPAQDDLTRIRQLAPVCVRIWARVLGGEHVFQMVDNIAQALSLAAGMLTQQLWHDQPGGSLQGV